MKTTDFRWEARPSRLIAGILCLFALALPLAAEPSADDILTAVD